MHGNAGKVADGRLGHFSAPGAEISFCSPVAPVHHERRNCLINNKQKLKLPLGKGKKNLVGDLTFLGKLLEIKIQLCPDGLRKRCN